MKKKLLITLLISVMFVCLFSTSAFAAPIIINDAWIALNGGVATYDMSTGGHVSGDIITIDASVPVTLTGNPGANVNIVCAAGTELILSDALIDCDSTAPGVCALSFIGADNTLNITGINVLQSGIGQPGIHAGIGTELTILGDGELYVYAGETDASGTPWLSGAAIGGGAGETGGTIIINMANTGYIEAAADYDDFSEGAGIGGGSKAAGGTMFFYGGQIDAYGWHAAGIGGGGDIENALLGGAAGNITFDGAEIYGYGYGYGGAGIGSGPFCADNSSGTITVESGYVYGLGEFGTGIGGGFESSCGSIVLRGGEIIGESISNIGIGSSLNSVSGGSIAISGNALVFAYGDGIIPDIAFALDTFSIEGTSEVFTAFGEFGIAPTTSHIVEPGNEVFGSDLTGVSSAYGFSDPNWPGSWESVGTYGWFVNRIAVNPQTSDSSSNYILLYILLGLLFAVGLFILIIRHVKVFSIIK